MRASAYPQNENERQRQLLRERGCGYFVDRISPHQTPLLAAFDTDNAYIFRVLIGVGISFRCPSTYTSSLEYALCQRKYRIAASLANSHSVKLNICKNY